LGYRLSDGRKGSRIGYGDDKIRYFNQKMIDIDIELKKMSVNPGKHLYILLEQNGLIPVYFKHGGPRDDSVPDNKCVNSVRGTQFVNIFFSLSSGKHHCRTCGRCMNDADTTIYNADPTIKNMFLNPVCIDCYELFSGGPTPGPGASAASPAP
jgi:hypothetical protein